METQIFIPQFKLQEIKWYSGHLRSDLSDTLSDINTTESPQEKLLSLVVAITYTVVLTVWCGTVTIQEVSCERRISGILFTLHFLSLNAKRTSVSQRAVSHLVSASQHHSLQNVRGHSTGVSSYFIFLSLEEVEVLHRSTRALTRTPASPSAAQILWLI